MSADAFSEGFEAAAVAEPLIAITSVLVVAVLVVVVKWGLPLKAKLREKELEIERYRIETQEKADTALDQRERERIKTTQRQVAAQEESNRIVDALRVQIATNNARLEDSKERSSEMGGKVERIDTTTSAMAKQLNEVHAIVVLRK